ncbi:MAG: tyrosine-type recombinase/integrase [Patescibacteria group bacterium]|nr:tyrosine-type recombinase/integrase [Patescibacteria group bacterium]
MPNLIELYDRDQARRGLSVSTRMSRRRCLSMLDAGPGLFAHREAIETFLDSRELSAKSRSVWISHLAGFYAWAIASGYGSDNPMVAVRPPKVPKGLPRPFSDVELDGLLAVAGPRMKAMLLLGALGGLRCMEMANLKAEDILEGKAVRVFGKGAKERIVPLHVELIAALDALGVQSGYLFLNRFGQPMSANGISHELGRYIHDCGVEGGAHRLRHWFGTNTYRSTLDIVLTQNLLGHSDLTSTSVYAAADQSRAVAAIGGLRVGA